MHTPITQDAQHKTLTLDALPDELRRTILDKLAPTPRRPNDMLALAATSRAWNALPLHR